MQLPEDFITRTKVLLGNEWNAFEQSLLEEIPVSIRLNPDKPTNNSYLEKVPWASHAYYLPQRPVFTLDPLFHAGAYYVQEASSMYLEQMLKDTFSEPIKVLDLCAAPGGKSTHLSALLPENSLLVANEVISGRSKILAENLIKWGNPNTIVTNNDPKDIGSLSGVFDLILADVPCSGEGMFRKDPSAIGEWSVNNVRLCAERQRRIVADSWPALKPGGILIYSTCTYNKEENEENISWICRELNAEIQNASHRFFPHKTRGEGFFIAALKKCGEDKTSVVADYHSSSKKTNTIPVNFNYIKQCLKKTNEFNFLLDSSRENNNSLLLRAFPKNHTDVYNKIKSKLKIVSSGIFLGEIKGKDLIPNHHLAMSTTLAESVFPRWEADKKTALRYLSKETLTVLPSNLPKGYVLLTYQNLPVGFVKNIGNRANNLYPSEWRIKMKINSYL